MRKNLLPLLLSVAGSILALAGLLVYLYNLLNLSSAERKLKEGYSVVQYNRVTVTTGGGAEEYDSAKRNEKFYNDLAVTLTSIGGFILLAGIGGFLVSGGKPRKKKADTFIPAEVVQEKDLLKETSGKNSNLEGFSDMPAKHASKENKEK